MSNILAIMFICLFPFSVDPNRAFNPLGKPALDWCAGSLKGLAVNPVIHDIRARLQIHSVLFGVIK